MLRVLACGTPRGAFIGAEEVDCQRALRLWGGHVGLAVINRITEADEVVACGLINNALSETLTPGADDIIGLGPLKSPGLASASVRSYNQDLG